MQITPDQLLGEAGRMALELRLKDQALAALEARVAELEQQLRPDGPEPGAAGSEPATHDHHAVPRRPAARSAPGSTAASDGDSSAS